MSLISIVHFWDMMMEISESLDFFQVRLQHPGAVEPPGVAGPLVGRAEEGGDGAAARPRRERLPPRRSHERARRLHGVLRHPQ